MVLLRLCNFGVWERRSVRDRAYMLVTEVRHNVLLLGLRTPNEMIFEMVGSPRDR